MSRDSANVVTAPALATTDEGDLVRGTNYLYKEYKVGRVRKAPNAHARVEFNPSVLMTPPYRLLVLRWVSGGSCQGSQEPNPA